MSIKQKSGGQLMAVTGICLLAISTFVFFMPIFFIGLLKLFPHDQWRSMCSTLIDKIVTCWCVVNNFFIAKTRTTHWEFRGFDDFKLDEWSMVIANHQSWLDIVVLHRLFTRKIPVIKFFIKDQLKWVPLLGFAWWAMGCPFMKRYSKEYLKKNPHKQGNDLKATQKAMRAFKANPVTICNFIEGTRFTPSKKIQQKSPYQHLLKPKAGGLSFVISAMNKEIRSLIDVTIVYPNNSPSLWDFICQRMDIIKVHVREIPIPQEFQQELLATDSQLQEKFRDWLNERWLEKDRLLANLKGSVGHSVNDPIYDENDLTDDEGDLSLD